MRMVFDAEVGEEEGERRVLFVVFRYNYSFVSVERHSFSPPCTRVLCVPVLRVQRRTLFLLLPPPAALGHGTEAVSCEL